MVLDTSGNLTVGGNVYTSVIGSSSTVDTGNVQIRGGAGNFFSDGARITAYGVGASAGLKGQLELSAGSGGTATSGDSSILFYTNNAEAGRIDPLGNLLVGASSTINGGLGVFSKPNGNQLVVNSENANGGSIDWALAGSLAARIGGITSNPSSNFQVQTNGSGGVQLPAGATAWAAMSDERLKDIIEPITNAVDKVSTLRAVIGKYKVDEADKRRAFLIAQDVLAVLPEATSMSTISLDDPEEYLAVQYTEVIPLLVAAIKELTARIETLEGA